MPAGPKPNKICVACGRVMTWRKKWERNWEQVKYCSDACRRGGSVHGVELEQAILTLLNERSNDASICPSEAARSVGREAWRDLMEPARQAARRLVAAGKVVITQNGREVDPSTARGAIRVRLRGNC